MTSEDLRSELEKTPFVPFRLHLVSGKTVDVAGGMAFMLQNAVMILHKRIDSGGEPGYNVISLRNIEMIELLDA